MKNKITIKDELTDFLLYTAPNGNINVEAFLHNETIWLSQKKIAELFGVDVTTINEHIKNIYKTNELDEISTIGNFPIVQIEGKREVKKTVIRNFRTTALDEILFIGIVKKYLSCVMHTKNNVIVQPHSGLYCW